jgi:hypothetical protein
MLPNREGRFKAVILEHGVAETGKNNLATFVCRFQLEDELVQNEWVHVDELLDITGYFYLEKKDGSLNTITIDALKSAFGWDGRDPMWLQDADFEQLVVQVKLAFEEHNGRTRIKVKYVDAENASPKDVPQADDSMRRSIANRLGSKLRANAGGTPAPAPKPAAGSRPQQPATAPATPAPAAASMTEQQAWEAFVRACPQDFTQQHMEKEWFRILGGLFPGKTPEQLRPEDWAWIATEAPRHITPF